MAGPEPTAGGSAPSAATRSCPSCGSPLLPGAQFCGDCGASTPDATGSLPESHPSPDATEATGSKGLIDAIAGNPVSSAIGMLLLMAVLSVVLWPVLRIPSQFIGDQLDPGSCAAHEKGSFDLQLCSLRVALARSGTAVLVALVAVFFKRPIQKAVGRLKKRLAPRTRMLVSPALVTTMFATGYAGIHANAEGQMAAEGGPVPIRAFPAVVGLVAVLLPRLLTRAIRRFPGPFAARDKLSPRRRLVLLAVVTVAMAAVTSSSAPQGSNQQLTVVAMMGLSFFGMTPSPRALVAGAAGTLQRTPPPQSTIPPPPPPPPPPPVSGPGR